MSLSELFGQLEPTNAPKNELTLREYLDGWKTDPDVSLNTAGRMLKAIGEPEVIDTTNTKLVSDGRLTKHELERLALMYSGGIIHRYPVFHDFFGIERQLHQIVQFFAHGAKGAQQMKQILYLCGPVGAAKSKLVDRLKQLYQKVPVYVLAFKEKGQDTPVMSQLFESPLGLFDAATHGPTLEKKFGVPMSRLTVPMSRWAAEKLKSANGDLERFCVMRVMPSMATRTCIARVEPGDDSTRVNVLVGQRGRSGRYEDYEYTGGLNRATQGVLEFVEMFTAKAAVLKPLLAAPQDRVYAGDGDVGELPFEGLIVAHSNEPEWRVFLENRMSTGLVSRICKIDFPFTLSVTAEQQIYRDGLDEAGYQELPVAPGALEVMANFAVATRVSEDSRRGKIRIYDGRPSEAVSKTADELRNDAGLHEGMDGASSRSILGWLAAMATADPKEQGLDPVSVVNWLTKMIADAETPASADEPSPDQLTFNGVYASEVLDDYAIPRCKEIVTLHIQRAFPENYHTFVTDKFVRYFGLLDAWIEERDFKDPDTNDVIKLELIPAELLKAEGISTILESEEARKDFRKDIWKQTMPFFEDGKPIPGETPWTGLAQDTWQIFEQNFLPKRGEMLPSEAEMEKDKKLFTIAFVQRDRKEDREKHAAFIKRICKLGTDEKARTHITELQARRFIEWYIANCK